MFLYLKHTFTIAPTPYIFSIIFRNYNETFKEGLSLFFLNRTTQEGLLIRCCSKERLGRSLTLLRCRLGLLPILWQFVLVHPAASSPPPLSSCPLLPEVLGNCSAWLRRPCRGTRKSSAELDERRDLHRPRHLVPDLRLTAVLTSGDSPTSASQVAGTTGVSHCSQQRKAILLTIMAALTTSNKVCSNRPLFSSMFLGINFYNISHFFLSPAIL